MSEPGGGSDLKAIRTTAIRDGDHYVVNGSKTFITNGGSADLIVTLVKTDPSSRSKGMSLLVVDTRDAAGFSVGRVLNKIGMKAQDTAELFFDNVKVPVENLLGVEGEGWTYAVDQLAHERAVIAIWGLSVLERAVHETMAYTEELEAYRGTLFDLQNTRLELRECATIARCAHLRRRLHRGTPARRARLGIRLDAQVLGDRDAGQGDRSLRPVARRLRLHARIPHCPHVHRLPRANDLT